MSPYKTYESFGRFYLHTKYMGLKISHTFLRDPHTKYMGVFGQFYLNFSPYKMLRCQRGREGLSLQVLYFIQIDKYFTPFSFFVDKGASQYSINIYKNITNYNKI